MQNVGIIAEFNPFHLGHEYLIKQAKKDSNNVICVMSGNFVQRGDTAIISKFARAKAAIECGADLVIEMPTPFAMTTAQNFAFSAVKLLADLKVIDSIVFGSECGEIEKLECICNLFSSEEFENKLKPKLNSSKTFAKLRQEALEELSPDSCGILENANDILAIEYLTALKKIKSDIKPVCIKRLGAKHNEKADGITASAGQIREQILGGDYAFAQKYMPEKSFETLKENPISDINRLENAILCSLRQKRLEGGLGDLPDVTDDLKNRFCKAIQVSSSLNELFENIKTKKYTLSRIRRMVLNTFLGIDKTFYGEEIPYIRVLGLSKKGAQILSDISKKSDLPIIAAASDTENLSDFGKKVFLSEQICTDFYSLSLSTPQKCGNEFYNKVFKGE